MRVLVAAPLLAVLAIGCHDRDDKRAEELEELAATIDSRLAPIALVEVPNAPRWSLGDRRVVVGDAIAVDRAALALQIYRADPEAYAESARPIPTDGAVVTLEDRQVPAAAIRGGTVRALTDALHEPPPGQMGESPNDVGGSVDLFIDGRTPYATFATILQTVVWDRRRPCLVVRSGGRLAALPLRFPAASGSCTGASCIPVLQEPRTAPEPADTDAERADEPAPDASLDLTLTIDDRGVDVFGSGGALEPGCQRLRAGSDDGPTIPRTAGALNGAAIEACLQAIADVFVGDDEVWIQPEPSTPFAEVALVASIAVGPRAERFPELRFARPDTER